MPHPDSARPVGAAVAVRSLVVPAVIVAGLSGGVVAVQGRLNGDLAALGAGTIVAGWLSYIGTLATVALVIAARGRLASTWRVLRRDGHWWWYAVGLCGIPIVLGMAAGIPVVGVAIASVCAVAGQTVSGLGFDARGVGLPQPLGLTRRRVLAGATAIAGLAVAVVAGSTGVAAQPLVVAAIGVSLFAAGAVLCGQQAGNGRIAAVTGDPVIAGLTSAAGGTVGVTLIAGMVALGGGLDGVTLPGASAWHLYLGGPLGAVITVAAAWSVRHLGTFVLTLAIVGGQMVTAIVLDVSGAVELRWPTVVAAVVICVATVMAVEVVRPAGPPSTP